MPLVMIVKTVLMSGEL